MAVKMSATAGIARESVFPPADNGNRKKVFVISGIQATAFHQEHSHE